MDFSRHFTRDCAGLKHAARNHCLEIRIVLQNCRGTLLYDHSATAPRYELSFVKMLSGLNAFGIINTHGGEFKVRSLWESNVTMLRLARIRRKEFLRTTGASSQYFVRGQARQTESGPALRLGANMQGSTDSG